MVSTPARIELLHSLTLTRHFQYGPQRLFSAWTDSELIRLWFHMGIDWATPKARVDLRPGGFFYIQMQSPDGDLLDYRGRYLKVNEPHSLVFTWPPYADPSIETRVTLNFVWHNDRTVVSLHHEGLLTQDMLRDHKAGWQDCLASLAARIGDSRFGRTSEESGDAGAA